MSDSFKQINDSHNEDTTQDAKSSFSVSSMRTVNQAALQSAACEVRLIGEPVLRNISKIYTEP